MNKNHTFSYMPPKPTLEEPAIMDLGEKEVAVMVDDFQLPRKRKRRRPVCLTVCLCTLGS